MPCHEFIIYKKKPNHFTSFVNIKTKDMIKLDESIIKCLQKKENLLDEFKKELDSKKDKEELISWIRKKDFSGRKYSKKIKAINKDDLKEA